MSRIPGPGLVAIAALLWGTDSIFRYQISGKLDPTVVVTIEHLLGVLALLPWIFWRHGREVFSLQKKEWLAAAFCGAAGSAVATTLFTLSFRYVNPSIAVLLQKLQPVMVVLIAFAVLGERPRRNFYGWALLALAAAIVLSLVGDESGESEPARRNHWLGVFYSLASAAIWGFSTVAGKVLATRVSASVSTFWRYVFGVATLGLMMLLPTEAFQWSTIVEREIWLPVLYVSLFSGILPWLFYYGGLKRTPASHATFIELLFPISSVLLNTLVLGTPFTAAQGAASAVLIFAVTMISRR